MADSRPRIRVRGSHDAGRRLRPVSPRLLVALRRLAIFCVAVAMLPMTLLLMGATVSRSRIQWQPDVSLGDTIWLQRMRERMAERRTRFREECSQRGLDAADQPVDSWEYLVSGPPSRLVWCSVFKAASTSWMYNFNILAGYSPAFLNQTKATPLELARQRYPRMDVDAVRSVLESGDAVSFIIVRHPLERLLSAYRDKLENALPHTHHEKLGMQIILRYRARSLQLPSPIVTPASNGKRSRRSRASVATFHGVFPGGWVNPIPAPPAAAPNPMARRPTFREFVMYLVDQWRSRRGLDMHWTPINNFCTPCRLQPEIIAKFETLKDDQNFIIYQAGLQDRIRPQWRNHAKGLSKTADLVNKYYSQLMQSQILQLYEIYKYDFLLFGYTLDGYLDLGIPDAPVTTKSPPENRGSETLMPTNQGAVTN